jgi:hypothetical protein
VAAGQHRQTGLGFERFIDHEVGQGAAGVTGKPTGQSFRKGYRRKNGAAVWGSAGFWMIGAWFGKRHPRRTGV